MNTYLVSTKNELYKLRHKKKTVWLFGILLVLSVVAVVAVFLIQHFSAVSAINSAEMSTWVLRQMGTIILPLFTAMLAIDLFTGETAQGTLKNALLMPIERFKVYLSKLTAVLVVIILMLAGMLLANMLMSVVLLGISGSGTMFIGTVIAYIGTVLPLFLLAVLTSFIALFVKSSSGAITLSIILYVICELVGTFSGRLSIYMPTNYMQWYRYPLGSNTSTQMLLFMIAYIIMFVSVSLLSFDRKEV